MELYVAFVMFLWIMFKLAKELVTLYIDVKNPEDHTIISEETIEKFKDL